MTEPTRILRIIRDKFPGQDTRVGNLYDHNEEFQLLCVDYVASLEALKDFQENVHQQGRSIEEYKELIRQLEKDLREYLKAK
jgi:hypothetical protein